MVEDSRQKIHDQQITAAVHGFTQVWNRFEVMLAKELAQIQQHLDGIHPGKESHPNANYELFYRVSNTIDRKKSLTMGELSNALAVPLSTATRTVDFLVDNDYLQRLPDPEDRRVVRVALTDAGRELHKTIDGYIRQRVWQILSTLSDDERTTLLALVSKVVSALKEIAK